MSLKVQLITLLFFLRVISESTCRIYEIAYFLQYLTTFRVVYVILKYF